MEVCFRGTIAHENEELAGRHAAQIERAARHHCKWSVDDASYLSVENATMDALRKCLGSDFAPQFEVRLRYKYALVKKRVQADQNAFERSHQEEAFALKEEGARRIQELREEKRRQEEKRDTKDEAEIIRDAGEDADVENGNCNDEPRRIRTQMSMAMLTMKEYSVEDALADVDSDCEEGQADLSGLRNLKRI